MRSQNIGGKLGRVIQLFIRSKRLIDKYITISDNLHVTVSDLKSIGFDRFS